MDKPLLSVIILTYNQPVYIYELIDSIIAQTYCSIEIIISDDASHEFNQAGISEYISNNKRENISNIVFIINLTNLGTVKSINNAIKRANGKYIKIIAGDDYYGRNDIFEKQVNYLECNKDCYIVSGKVQDCLDNNTIENTVGVLAANKLQSHVYSMPSSEKMRYCFVKNIFPYSTQSFCFQRNFFSQYGDYDEKYKLVEDIPMATRIIENEIKIGVLDVFVVNHRVHSGMSTNQSFFAKGGLQYYFDLKLLFCNLMKRENSLIWKLYYYNRYKVTCYRISVANNDGKKVLLTIKYLPTLILYALFNRNASGEKFIKFWQSANTSK